MLPVPPHTQIKLPRGEEAPPCSKETSEKEKETVVNVEPSRIQDLDSFSSGKHPHVVRNRVSKKKKTWLRIKSFLNAGFGQFFFRKHHHVGRNRMRKKKKTWM